MELIEGEPLSDCYICNRPFTKETWDIRHSDFCGEDIHEECCKKEGPCSPLSDANLMERWIDAGRPGDYNKWKQEMILTTLIRQAEELGLYDEET